MKKLLTIFGAFALTATGASSVVACNKNTSTTDSNINQDSYTLDQIFPNKDLGDLNKITIYPIDDADSISHKIFSSICDKLYELNRNEKTFKKAEVPYNFSILMGMHYSRYLKESKNPDYLSLDVNSKKFTFHYVGEKFHQKLKDAKMEKDYQHFSKFADSDITVTFNVIAEKYQEENK